MEVDIELCMKDFEKFQKAMGIKSERDKKRMCIKIEEKYCTCMEESQWIRVKHLEKFGYSDIFTCGSCNAVHICNESCQNLMLTRECWTCSISGIEKEKIVSSDAFFGGNCSNLKNIINPLDKCSTCSKIIVGPISDFKLESCEESKADKIENTIERYKESVDSVIEKIIFNNYRLEKRSEVMNKFSKDIKRHMKKLTSEIIEKPMSFVSNYETLLSEYERMCGNTSSVKSMNLSEKTCTKLRLNRLITSIRFQLMKNIKKRHYPKTEYQILSLLYLLQNGWPGIFEGDSFLKKYLPLKKELQQHQNLNLNRLSKSNRDIKKFFVENILSRDIEKRKLLNILRE